MSRITIVEYLNGYVNEELLLEYVEIRMSEQGRKSTHFDHQLKIIRCSYRGEGGCRDTIGMILPDHLYVPEMDRGNHTSVCYLVQHYMEHLGVRDDVDPKFLKMRCDFLQDLQVVHDTIRQEKRFYQDDLEKNFKALRYKWGLVCEGTDY
jgi:hypothetical protein